MPPFDCEAATQALVAVTGGGRGFVMQQVSSADHSYPVPLVVTAAHCLPHLPPADPWLYLHERTYNLLGTLDEAKPVIAGLCLYVDPIADIAVLGAPDDQALPEEYDAFESLIEGAMSLRLSSSKLSAESVRCWVLSKTTSRWEPCQSEIDGRVLYIHEGAELITPGMSGSPILLDDGTVLGLLSNGRLSENSASLPVGPQPILAQCLPVWICESLSARKIRPHAGNASDITRQIV